MVDKSLKILPDHVSMSVATAAVVFLLGYIYLSGYKGVFQGKDVAYFDMLLSLSLHSFELVVCIEIFIKQEQKQMLGERLFPLIQQTHDAEAG